MMHEECEMNEKIKLKPKIKQNATKYKVHMTFQDEETRYRPMKKQGIDQCMTRVANVCARSSYMQCMTKAWKMHI